MRSNAGRRKKHRERPGATAPAPAKSRRRWLPGAVAAALLLAAALFVVARWRSTQRAASLPPAHADPAAAMSVTEAATEAARLYRANRAFESLPYYRRVAPEIAPDRLDFRLEFASALQNASLQVRARSRDRVRLVLEALDQLAIAERAMKQPRDRARAIVARAFFLRVWGFPTDALAELHRAISTDPSYPELAETARLMELRMRGPTLPLEAIEGLRVPRIRY